MKTQLQIAQEIILLAQQLADQNTMSSNAGLFQARPPSGAQKKKKACDFKLLVERRLARIKK